MPSTTNIKPETESWINEDSKDNSHEKQRYDKPEPDGFVHSFDNENDPKDSLSAHQLDFIKLGNPAIISAIKLKNPQAFIFSEDYSGDIEQSIDRDLEKYGKRENPLKGLSKKDIKIIQDQIGSSEIKSKFLNEPPIKAVQIHYKEIQPVGEGITKLELFKMAPRSKKKFGFLPWWFIYINWGLALLTIALCSFFTILYGFKLGFLRSVGWIKGVSINTVFSVIIFQPLNAFLLSVFYVTFYQVMLY